MESGLGTLCPAVVVKATGLSEVAEGGMSREEKRQLTSECKKD